MADIERMAARLNILAMAVAQQRWEEFSMRVPAEPDRDADIVLMDAATELVSLSSKLGRAESERDEQRRLKDQAQTVAMKRGDELAALQSRLDAAENRWRLAMRQLEELGADNAHYAERAKALIAQLAEHDASNVGAAGSSPAERSIDRRLDSVRQIVSEHGHMTYCPASLVGNTKPCICHYDKVFAVERQAPK